MTGIPAVILAGGLARRMGGGDKALLDLGGQSLLSRVIDRIGPQAGPLALNANGDPARFAAFGLPVLADTIDGFAGPLAGILAALDWAEGLGASQVVTVAADTPFFPQDLVERLLDAGFPMVLAATTDEKRGVLRQPTFGLWPVDFREDLQDALTRGIRKVVQWSDQHGAGSVVFETAAYDPFFNINTAEDLAEAEAMLAKGVV